MSHYDITFQADNHEEAMEVRDNAFNEHRKIIVGSSGDPRQKGKYWHSLHVIGYRNKNTLRNFLGRHPDVNLVTVRRHK